MKHTTHKHHQDKTAGMAFRSALALFGAAAFATPAFADTTYYMVGAGDNGFGQMADGTTEDAPVPFLVESDVVDVACGRLHTVFLVPGSDYYDMYCAGSNANCQLGNEDVDDPIFTSVNATPFKHASGVLAVSAGAYFTLYLSTNYDLFAMGSNEYGQTSDDNSTIDPYPHQVVDNDNDYAELKVSNFAAGYFHTLFVTKTDGALYTVGASNAGQMGSGSLGNTNTPTEIEDSGISLVAGGESHSLFTTTDGALYSMGDNTYGQLGTEDNETNVYPVLVADSGVAEIAAGRFFSLFVDDNNDLYVTGDNTFGQLGTGDTDNLNTFTKTASGVSKVFAGRNQSFYITTDGDLYAAGYNNYGQLCDGTTTEQITPIKVAEDVVKVASGDYHTMYLTTKFDSPYYPNYKLGGKWGYTMGWIDDTYFPWVWDYTEGCWFYVYGGIYANQNTGYWIYYFNSDCTAGNWGYVGSTTSGGIWCLNSDGSTYTWVTSGDTLPTY